jgi:hypothetical protein
MKLANTRCGFKWGPAEVVRLCDDPRRGVWLLVGGRTDEIEIRVTPSGRLRISQVRKADTLPHVTSPELP